MAQGPSDTILVAIRITLRIRESKVRNPDLPDRRRFVLSEHIFLVYAIFGALNYYKSTVHRPVFKVSNKTRVWVVAAWHAAAP